MKSLESLTNKIQSHCPELLELSFGCWVKCIDQRLIAEYGLIGCGIGYKDCVLWDVREGNISGHRRFDNSFIFHEKKMFEILGHPIRLEHVLRAIEKQYENEDSVFYINSVGLTYRIDTRKTKKEWDKQFVPLAEWDLSKGLSDQSPETIEWLNSVIK